MSLRVTLVQGGGVGWDQVPAVQRIIAAAGVAVIWDEHLAGLASVERGGPPLPADVVESVRASGLALKTKLLSPPGPPQGNSNLRFRRELGVFASVRPLKNIRGLRARFQGVDMLVLREMTEDLYAAIEHEIVPGVVQSLKIVTEAASRRFLRFAFEFIVDNCCMQMVSKPQQFDVLVMGNLYGDLVSDLGAGVVGGISATAGINIGEGVRVYECFHGGSRETIGANRANPLPLLLPALDLLKAEGHVGAARRILDAVESVLSAGQSLTHDLGGAASTTEMADAVIAALK